MNKLKQLSKQTKIIISIIVVCLLIGSGYGIYLLTRDTTIPLTLKDKKDITIEYGETYNPNFNDLVKIKDLDKDDIKELKKGTKMSSNIVNEEGKEYPAVGEYKITIKYDGQKKTKKLIIKDTVAPVFNETNEVSFDVDTKDFDFNSQISATDLATVTMSYDTSTLDISKAGEYTVKATATDANGNIAEKDIKVTVKEKVVKPITSTGSNVSGITYAGGGKVVCIDAGHQARGNNEKEPNGPGSSVMKAKVTTGATGVSTGSTESSINLKVAIKLQQILSSRGYTVVMCRTSQDVNISNAERATIANNANAGAFVRLHCDSSDSSSPTGTMTMAPSTSNPYCTGIASSSQRLSRCVLNNTCAAAGSKSRGVSITDSMTGLNWAKVPVTIIEMGFLSNPGEDQLLSSDDYQSKLATGIANGIGEFLN